MRKYLCYILSVLLLVCCPAAVTEAAQTAAPETDIAYQHAAALLQTLTDIDVAGWEPEAPISRGDFIQLLSEAAHQTNIATYNGTFADVPAAHPAADAVYGGLALGFIAAADSFYPEADITGAAACKLAVCYAGYQPVAEARGGYPSGYVMVARQENFLKGTDISADTAVSCRDAVVLVFNLLMADAISPSVVGAETSYYKTGETNLAAWHGIYSAEGVVNATPYSSLTSGKRVWERPQIEVEGVAYEADSVDEALLGFHCTAYYRLTEQRNRQLVLLWPKNNTETAFALKNYRDLQGRKLEYYDEEKDKNSQLTLADSPVMLFNGRYLPFDASYFSLTEGSARLVDNNNDGRAEIVFISSYRYLEIDHISPVGGTIGDAYDSSQSLNLNARDTIYRLLDMDGNPLTLYDLQVGDILAVQASADNLFITLWLCENSVSGTVTQVDLQDNMLWLDNEAYDVSDYLKAHDSNALKPGVTGNFRLGLDNRLVSYTEAEGTMQYAYLMDYTKRTGSFACGQLKAFTRSGEIKILNLPDKLTVDGGSEKLKQSDFIERLRSGSYPCPSLVKLAYTADDVLLKIDFPALFAEGTDPKTLPEDNSLLQYRFFNDEGQQQKVFRYRSAPKSCMPYFNLLDTVVFKIPADLSDEESFYVGDNSGLLDNSDYALSVYDLNEGGSAGAVLWRRSGKSESFTYHDPTYIVEAVTQGVDDEGNQVQLVKTWSLGTYKTLYLDYGFDVSKPSGAALCGGDIIRVKLDNHNKITAISVDFDASGGIPVPGSTDSSLYGGANINLTYQFGKLYRVYNGYAYLSDAKDVFGDYDYSFANQKNFYVQTQNIIKYDSQTKKLRPIKLEELKSYVSAGRDNHYVVLRQSIFNINSIYVYE